MEDHYFEQVEKKRGTLLIVALVLMLAAAFMGFGIDLDQFAQHAELQIPGWYFYLIFFVDLLVVISVILIFFFRRIGVFLFPAAILLHFFFHLYFLNTFVYSDLLALFFISSFALLAIIPKWKFFK